LMTLQGGEIRGKSSITAATGFLGAITLTQVTAVFQNIDLGGFSTLSGAAVTVTTAGRVSAASQFTMGQGSTFSIGSACQFSHGNPLSFNQAGDTSPPLVTNDGRFASASSLSVNVNVRGAGFWDFGPGSSLSTSGVIFSGNTVNVVSQLKFVVSTVNLQSLTGPGSVEVQGKEFVARSVAVGTFSHVSGQSSFDTGTFNTLTISGGDFNITRSVQATTLNFVAGNLQGSSFTGVSLNTTNAVFSGPIPKFLSNLSVSSTAFTFNCGNGGSCQLMTKNAMIVPSARAVKQKF